MFCCSHEKLPNIIQYLQQPSLGITLKVCENFWDQYAPSTVLPKPVMSNWWPAGQKWPSEVPKMARKGSQMSVV